MNRPQIISSEIELALRESQDRLTGIIASAMDAIITIDQDQVIILFNAAAEKMFGYEARQIMGKPIDLLLPERFRERHRQHVDHFGQTGVTNRDMGRLGTLFGRRANGREFPIEASISQVESAGGRLYTVILRDVTSRVEAENRLVESEQQLRATFEQAAVGIAHVDPNGRYVRVNQRFCQIAGRSEDDMLKLSFQEITHPEDLPRNVALQKELLEGKIPTYSLEKRLLRPDGSLMWIAQSVSLVRAVDGQPRYAIKVIEDITARKQAEAALQARSEEVKTMSQQLWQSAKLATMGELAASIAHELNNPLATISLRIESLLASFPPTAPQVRELQIMEQETERMASLVANLLQFSRSTQHQVSSLDVREEIDKTLELVHTHLLHHRITVERSYDANLSTLHADRQQLRQLFLNLFTNASDAMPEGGTLTIRVGPVEQAKKIEIDITDTGIGIKPSDLRLVMEPFYTTKVEGKGTGLGLAICRRIIEEHNGTLQLSSAGEGKGATVKILLPTQNEGKSNVILDE